MKYWRKEAAKLYRNFNVVAFCSNDVTAKSVIFGSNTIMELSDRRAASYTKRGNCLKICASVLVIGSKGRCVFEFGVKCYVMSIEV